MSRFYVDKESVRGDTIVIGGEEAHHIIDVMRLKLSDAIVAFDSSGREYAGVISGIKGKSVSIKILRTIEEPAAAALDITLIQAIPKRSKMDYIVEKAAELGVSSVAPVFTARTIPDWDQDKRSASVKRWRKIALEAAKQCGRRQVPSITEIKDLSDALEAARGSSLALIAALVEETVDIRTAVKGFKGGKISVAIGPEGDFTPEEVDAARERGFKAITLGPRVLKSDTAGLAVLAILDYELTR